MPGNYGELQDRGVARAMQTRFGLVPDFSLAFMPEIAATYDLLSNPETLLHMGWSRWSSGRNIAAVAGQVGRINLRNPTNSSVLVVVDRFVISAGAGSTYQFAPGSQTDLATTFGATAMDTRTPQAGPVAVLSTDTNAVAFVSSLGEEFFLASTPTDVVAAAGRVLAPGGAIELSIGLVNTVLAYTIQWRERKLQEQENTP